MLYGKSWELNLLNYETTLGKFPSNLHQFIQIYVRFRLTLIRHVKNDKIYVDNFQGRHFLRKKSPCGLPHNLAKGLRN
jgi:hypothetical protein